MSHITDNFYEKTWGIFLHYLYKAPYSYNPEPDWNKRIDTLDTDKIAETIHETGARYLFITVMQGTKHMIAPNATYDKLLDCNPGDACSKRDLIDDLYNSLSKYGIDLYLYFTGDGPWCDENASHKLGFFEPRKNISEEFVRKWAAVAEEYAVRYKDKIKGWWFDGCYDYFGYNNALLEIYYNAVKKGNPNALTSFNNGDAVRDDVPCGQELKKWYEHEEFTCGELNDFTLVPKSRFCDGAQSHLLIPLGLYPNGNCGGWCSRGCVRGPEYLSQYITTLHENGCVLTIDIHIGADGTFDFGQIEVLKKMSQLLNEKK